MKVKVEEATRLKLQAGVQAAVDATSRAQEEDGLKDVLPYLRKELESRNVNVYSDGELRDLAERVRGARVTIKDLPEGADADHDRPDHGD
jgi:hypothetical protein